MGIFKKIFNSIGGNYETPVKTRRSAKPTTPHIDKSSAGGEPGIEPALERAFERPTSSQVQPPNMAGAMNSRTAMSTYENDKAPFPLHTVQTIKERDMDSASPESSKFSTSGLDSTLTDETFLEEVVHAFDEAFDAVTSSDMKPGQMTEGKVLLEETVQDLFVQMATNYALPLKNFIFELRRGTATKDWIEICRPALRSISRAAENMYLSRAAKRMTDFDEVLSLAQLSPERWIGGEIRECILASYEALIEALPEAFQVGEEAEKREELIIKSLLKQIPGLGRVTFEKLYGAGLGSMNMLFLANKEDLAAATTIPLWMCERICNRVQQYRKEVEDMPLDAARSGYRFRLSNLVNELRRHGEEFECDGADAGSHPDRAAKKRQCRQSRQRCLLQIMLMLAELGELDFIHKIQRLSFRRRIQKLDEYLTTSAG